MFACRKLPKLASVLATSTVALASCAQGDKGAAASAALTAKVAELETKLAYLTDRQQIHDVYMRYMRGFDRNDVELLKSSFWPDVQIGYGTQSSNFDEFVVQHLDAQTKRHPKFAHLLTNESVELAGDVAHVESYVTELLTLGNGKSMIVSGRYLDRLDRRNGEWRIAMREFIPHFWTETNTALGAYIDKEGGWWPQSGCMRGTWDRHDPSYRRPLTRRTGRNDGPACAE